MPEPVAVHRAILILNASLDVADVGTRYDATPDRLPGMEVALHG
jgi:hypothetical protein